MSESERRGFDLYAPTPEHALLAADPARVRGARGRAAGRAHDRDETFNLALFRRAGALGLLGVTIGEEYGGAGLDATAAVQVYEALSTSDPGFALAVLAHAVLFAQNVNVNGNELQKKHVLPRAGLGRVGGRHVHDRARRRDGRARDAHAGAPRRRRLRARRHQDLHHQRRHRRAHARRRLRRLRRDGRAQPQLLPGREGHARLPARAEVEGQARHARVLHRRAGVRGRARAGREPPGRGGRGHARDDAQPRDRAAHAGRDVARHRAALPGRDDRLGEQRKSFGVPIREHGQVQRYIAESFAEWRAARCLVYDTARRFDLDVRRPARRRRRGQAVRLPGRQARRRRGDPGARRLRLHGRERRRAALARRQAARDRRRHARGPPQEPDAGSDAIRAMPGDALRRACCRRAQLSRLSPRRRLAGRARALFSSSDQCA